MSRCLRGFVISFIFLAHVTVAQSLPEKPKADKDRIAKEQRVEARSLLLSLAGDARSFRDQVLRARSLARIADALWGVDPDQSRTLFRQAWEAAEIAQRENKERLNIRTEVLTLAATHDHQLAEQFLQKLKDELQDNRTDGPKNNLWALAEASQQRLSLAERLLQSGDVSRAQQFADPVLNLVTISTLNFLTRLRADNAAAADQRYATMLANAGASVLTDANTISLLSSYIFTPRTYVTFNSAGAADSAAPAAPLPPANVSPQLRLAFFRTACAVLLREQPSPELDQSTTGILGKYMVLKRLLPFFEQYAPRDLTEAMRGHFTALNSQMSDGMRHAEIEWSQQEIGTNKAPADSEQFLLDQIERAKTADERDDFYLRLALIAIRRDDSKARDYAGKIEDGEIRRQAQAWVDWGFATRAIKNRKAEIALDLARNGELSHIQKVWILSQSAKLLATSDPERTVLLLDEAGTEARRIDSGDLTRPQALMAIANAASVSAPARVWEAIFDAVKAANAVESFRGEDGVLTLTVNGKSHVLRKTEPVSDFDIEGIFREVAGKDFERAVQLARGFREEAPRANATLAICRAVLSENNGTNLTSSTTVK